MNDPLRPPPRRPGYPGKRGPAAAATLLAAAAALGLASPARAEDSDAFRPYLGFRYGEFNVAWDVHDLWGFSLGANLDRHWSVELGSDLFEVDLLDSAGRKRGEVSVIDLVPTVRYRLPLFQGRLVPYLLAGAGPSFIQFNDRKAAGFGQQIDARGTVFSAAVGGGLDWFVTDNVALNLEGRYLFTEALGVRYEQGAHTLDASTPLLTVGLRVFFREIEPRPLPTQARRLRFHPYFGVRVGASHLVDDQLGNGLEVGPEVSAFLGDSNQTGSIVLGANLGRHWNVEVSLEQQEYNLRHPDWGDFSEYAAYAIMPTVGYRWPLGGGRWVPYLAAGVGAVYGEVNDIKPRGKGLVVEGGGFRPALRAGGGLEYFVTSNFSLTTDVRYLHTWGQDVTVNGVDFGGDFSNVSATLGFRLYFTRPPAE
ncbi:MAG: outer membrane protein [Verrucomicrobiota bacterium]